MFSKGDRVWWFDEGNKVFGEVVGVGRSGKFVKVLVKRFVGCGCEGGWWLKYMVGFDVVMSVRELLLEG